MPHTSTAVAYQGAPGAYSEGAALHAVPGSELLPCEQFETAFEALSHGHAGRAVLPIENSLGGSIHAVYDLLIRCARAHSAHARPTSTHDSPTCLLGNRAPSD